MNYKKGLVLRIFKNWWKVTNFTVFSLFLKTRNGLPKSFDKYSRTDEKQTILPVFFKNMKWLTIYERRSIDSQLQPKPSKILFSSCIFFFFPTKKIILLWCQCNNMRFSALNYVTIVCHSRSHDPKPPQSREGSGDDSKILRTLPKCVTQTPVYSEMDTGTTR